ncbi:MAG: cache domain-containing protein [Bryobacteraceae bacterium]
MALDRLEVRISITKVLIALIVIIVPLSIVGFILTARSDKALDTAIGNDFKTIADTYSNEVSQFIRDRVVDVNIIAADPALIDAVSAADRNAATQPGAAASGQGRTNKAAKAGVAAVAARGGVTSNASELLRRRREMDPRFLGVLATDQNGAVVAPSQKQARQSLAQEPDWQAAYADGKGAVKIGGILFDEFTRSYYVYMNVPIFDPASSRCIGVLAAAVNISSVLSRFQQAQIANGARAQLVSDDGSIVSAPNADVFAHLKSQEFDAVRESLGSVQGRQTGSLTTSLGSGQHIIGFADTGLKQHYDNLGWIVIVSQEEHQVAAPIRQLGHFALLMVILGLLMVTLLCVYYYLHRTQKFSEIAGMLPSQQERTRAVPM